MNKINVMALVMTAVEIKCGMFRENYWISLTFYIHTDWDRHQYCHFTI